MIYIYTHVLNRGGRGVESPADRLAAVLPVPDILPKQAGYRADRPSINHLAKG